MLSTDGSASESHSADDAAMVSTTWLAGTVLVAVLAVAYFVVVAQQVLVGVLLAALVYGTGWIAAVLAGSNRSLSHFTPRRAIATAVVSAAILLYALLVAAQILLGLLVVAVVVLVSWVTSPRGPVVRRLVRDEP